MAQFDIILDNSQRNLKEVPAQILTMCNLKMLYLEGNHIQSLPPDFFPNLVCLTWLDLRNNCLSSIPRNIGNHAHLENLLLNNNNLDKLPNELGLIPKLKVLHLSDNPLIYPDRKIIAKGVKQICYFLREQYEKFNSPYVIDEEREEEEQDELDEELDDTLQQPTQDLVKKRLQAPVEMNNFTIYNANNEPNSKSGTSTNVSMRSKVPGKVFHKLSKANKKITLKSCCITTRDKFEAAQLREDFLNRLKMMLIEQEKILQQEKNLQTLNEWRRVKKAEAPQPITIMPKAKPPPYGTDSEYDMILSRQDLSQEIDKLIEKSRKVGRKPPKIDVDQVINGLITQLKDMENSVRNKSASNDLQEAQHQINMIMGIHKQLAQIRNENNSFF